MGDAIELALENSISRLELALAREVVKNDELSQKIEAVQGAINGYYTALNKREHGGVAMDNAIRQIESVLGMSWKG